MSFEDYRSFPGGESPDEAELFYRDLMGFGVRARRRRPRLRLRPSEDWAGETAVGQARISDRQYVVEPNGAAVYRAASLDDALLRAIERRAGHFVILGDAVGGTSFAVHSWGPAGSLPTPRTIEFDGNGVAALIVNGGNRLYVQASPTATTAADRLLWVHVPAVEEFLRLPSAARSSQRSEWVRRIRQAGVANPSTGAGFSEAELGVLSTPVLRVLLAQNSDRTLPVGTVSRNGTDRGGVVHGVTLPMLRYPIAEPQVYLRVITMAEGKMESINAYDAEAGISLGPIQINVQRAALFRFLWSVWQEDRRLFEAKLNAGWTMRNPSGYPELGVTVASRTEWLAGTPSNTDVRRNYAYLQSGDPSRPAYSQADPNHRRILARRFAGLIAWPHIQELLEDSSASWLQAGLEQVHAAGIPALDPNVPDRDLFILKSLLLSAYVRFSGCLGPFLRALGRWSSVRGKLANWRTALASMDGACSASGDDTQRGRNANLLERLGRQERDAQAVLASVEAILAVRRTAAGGASSPSMRAEVYSLRARNAAELFDRVLGGDELAARERGLRVLARPGEALPSNVAEGALLVTRGEGRFAVAREVREIAPGEWEMEGLRSPLPLGRGNRLGFDQLLVEPLSAELVTSCGFFGPNVRRTESEVRNAVRDAARAEWRNWHAQGQTPRLESDVDMFGHLVRYYVSTIRQIRPDTLMAIQTNAIGTINYSPIPGSTAANSAIQSWATRISSLLLAGAPNAGAPANLAAQVTSAVTHAREAHLNQGDYRAWSAAWVTACVRGAAIQLGLEAMIQGNHSGRDELLLASGRHADYTFQANQRRAGPNRMSGTYQAFDPADRQPAVGDIIVQDRHASAPASPLTYAQINSIAGGYELHGDIVVEVAQDHLVTIGGNLGDSCRQRRYPLSNGRLLIARNQLYVGEDNSGALPALPATTTERLHSRSTLRIFALLSPVETCAAVPGQPYGGGILT